MLTCINCLHAFRTENKLKSQESMYQNHDCCFIKMSEKCNKILKYDQDKQSMKIQFSFYIVTETLIRFSIRISIRFKAIALLSLVDNPADEPCKDKCKARMSCIELVNCQRWFIDIQMFRL